MIPAGENVQLSVVDEMLTIQVDLKHRGELSATGKTRRIASTCGNIPIPGCPDIKVGLNVYIKPRPEPANMESVRK